MIDDLVRTDFSLVDKRDEVHNVFGYIWGENENVPVITDGDRAYGVLNEKGMMKSRVDPHEKVEGYVIGTRLVSPRASLEEAVDVCLTSGLQVVPVEREGEVVGVVTAADLLRRVMDRRDADARATDLMREAPTLEGGAKLGEALHQLRETGLEALPVVDDEGRVAGVIRRRALLKVSSTVEGLQGSKRGLDREDQGDVEHRLQMPVQGWMDTQVPEVGQDASAAEVRDALREFDVAVVVDDHRRPVGVATATSALRGVHGP